MTKFGQFLLVVLASVITSTAIVFYYQNREIDASSKQESAYDRVLRTKTLRCGYSDWPPYVFTKFPTTGKFSGIFFDVTEALGRKLGITVEWTANVGYGSFIEDLRSHRIDAVCTGIWRNATRGLYASFTTPVFYSPVYPYVGVNEHRFDNDLSSVNSPDIRISAMDGEMSDVIAKEHFPKAKEVSIPQLGQITDILVNLADGKADIVFNEPSFVEAFIKNNPGKIRRLADKPFEVFPTSYPVDISEPQLHDMLDSALVELLNQGVVDEIISKYNPDPKVFLRVAKPYAE